VIPILLCGCDLHSVIPMNVSNLISAALAWLTAYLEFSPLRGLSLAVFGCSVSHFNFQYVITTAIISSIIMSRFTSF